MELNEQVAKRLGWTEIRTDILWECDPAFAVRVDVGKNPSGRLTGVPDYLASRDAIHRDLLATLTDEQRERFNLSLGHQLLERWKSGLASGDDSVYLRAILTATPTHLLTAWLAATEPGGDK